MEEPKKVKKIQRIAKGEEVLVPVMSEDLQDLYEKGMELMDDAKRAFATAKEDPENIELWIKYEDLEFEENITKLKFWRECRVRYRLHGPHEFALRDGYAIVKVPRRDTPPFIRHILGDEKDA